MGSAPGTVHRARKRFGQHFLEPAWVEKVIRAIDPRPDDAFIEIGPGRGALTLPLAARTKSILAFEIDRDLAAGLKRSAPPNVTVIEGDFLERVPNPGSQIPNPCRIAGNLPYNVASPIMFKLVELASHGVPLVDATLMLQREVADRLVARPGGKEYGVLSVLIQRSADVTRLLNLPPGAFRPPPKVQSTLVHLRFRPAAPAVRDARVFEELVQAVFTRRRKTLANALLAYLGTQEGRRRDGAGTEPQRTAAAALRAADLDGRRRPETLTVAEFARLADVLGAIG